MLRFPRSSCSVLLVLTLAGGLVTPSCARPTTIVTPQGQRAYTADDIVTQLGFLSKAVIAGSDQGTIRVADARKIIIWISGDANATPPIEGLTAVLATAPQGWPAILNKGYDTIRPLLVSYAALATYVPILDAAVGRQP